MNDEKSGTGPNTHCQCGRLLPCPEHKDVAYEVGCACNCSGEPGPEGEPGIVAPVSVKSFSLLDSTIAELERVTRVLACAPKAHLAMDDGIKGYRRQLYERACAILSEPLYWKGTLLPAVGSKVVAAKSVVFAGDPILLGTEGVLWSYQYGTLRPTAVVLRPEHRVYQRFNMDDLLAIWKVV